jgi:hypothetical protein
MHYHKTFHTQLVDMQHQHIIQFLILYQNQTYFHFDYDLYQNVYITLLLHVLDS